MNDFKYAAGLPGYGLNGKDGSFGLSGFSIYITDLSGEDGTNSVITNKINNNIGLFSSDSTNIAGYPLRVYQTNDLIIDSESNVYIIDLTQINRYRATGISFGSSEFLVNTIFKNGFYRYTNIGQDNRKLIDIVFGNTTNYFAYPSNIYGLDPTQFGQIFFSSKEYNGYNPYTVFNTNSNSLDDAVALVRNTSSKIWRFGNLDNAGMVRNTSLILDFKNIKQTIGLNQYNIVTYNDIDASVLFGTGFDSTPIGLTFAQDGSTVTVSWDSTKILASNNLTNISASLYVYPVKNFTGQIVRYEPSSGSLLDTASDTRFRTDIVTKINTAGSVKITGLDENLEYATFVEYSLKGWVRRTSTRGWTTTFKYIKFEPHSPIVGILSTGETRAFGVESNVNWTITSKPTWVTVTPSSGMNTTVTITAASQGMGSNERSGAIVFQGGGITRTMNITQRASSDVENAVDTGTPWLLMTRGPKIKTTGFNVRIRRIGNLCIVQGTLTPSSDLAVGDVIASIQYDSIRNSVTDGYFRNTTNTYFGSSAEFYHNHTGNRGFEGYVPAVGPLFYLNDFTLNLKVSRTSADIQNVPFVLNFSFFVDAN